jgi:hypothetical protein
MTQDQLKAIVKSTQMMCIAVGLSPDRPHDNCTCRECEIKIAIMMAVTLGTSQVKEIVDDMANGITDSENAIKRIFKIFKDVVGEEASVILKMYVDNRMPIG